MREFRNSSAPTGDRWPFCSRKVKKKLGKHTIKTIKAPSSEIDNSNNINNNNNNNNNNNLGVSRNRPVHLLFVHLFAVVAVAVVVAVVAVVVVVVVVLPPGWFTAEIR